MRKSTILLTSALLLPSALTLSCGGGTDDPDERTGVKGCPGNSNVDPQSATDLAAGQSKQGYLCPVGSQHWFRITVPEGQQIVSVDLRNDTTLTAVKLTYDLRGADGQMPVDSAPPPKVQGMVKQSLRYSHCVPAAGTYYLQVHSYADDAADVRNPFTISYTTEKNPDPRKPGNTNAAGAVDLAGGEQRGYIACKGEKSFYKLNVPDGHLLDLRLSTAAPTPRLNLKYTLLDAQMGYVADDAAPSGAAAATDLRVIRAVPKGGTYYVVVEDQGSGADLANAFTLKATTFQEPDQQDRTTRNDVAAAATDLGSFACGGSLTLPGKTGFLASRADVDWYKLRLSGVGPTCQVALEVDASWGGGGQAITPQVSLIYPDMYNADMAQNTPCVKDSDCRVLKRTCSDDNRCEFVGHQCNRQEGRCAASAVCLPEGHCGALQYAKQQDRKGTEPARVRTAQPLSAAGVYYLRVRDFQSQGYDAATPYTLAVRLVTDDGEANNTYNPLGIGGVPGGASFEAQYKISLGAPRTSAIRYERDVDYYVFDHPCPGADCTLSATYSTSAASPVYFTYEMLNAGGKTLAAWPAAPMPRMPMAPRVPDTVFGDGVNTCLFAAKDQGTKLYIKVADLLAQGGPLWDLNATYTFTLRKVQDGCSDLCKNKFGCGK